MHGPCARMTRKIEEKQTFFLCVYFGLFLRFWETNIPLMPFCEVIRSSPSTLSNMMDGSAAIARISDAPRANCDHPWAKSLPVEVLLCGLALQLYRFAVKAWKKHMLLYMV